MPHHITFTLYVILVASILPGGTNTAQADSCDLAGHVSRLTGIRCNLISIVGGEDADLALRLAAADKAVVHVWCGRDEKVSEVRDKITASDLYGRSIIMEQGEAARLPYADNIVDLLACTHLTAESIKALSLSEIARVLRPGGAAILGRRKESPSGLLDESTLRRLVEAGPLEVRQIVTDALGLWAVLKKPYPEGADDWSHWEHGPDNNPVSNDQLIKAPYLPQFFAEPYYIAMPAITTAAAGRTFLAMGHIAHHEREEPWLNTLVAGNGYNGIELWRMKLPDGYLVHRSAFIATANTFFMIDLDGRGLLMLDPETGREQDRLRLADHPGYWKWMALQDNVLHVLIGDQPDPAETTVVRSVGAAWSWAELSKGYYTERVPWGFGRALLAYDLNQRKVLWNRQEDHPIDSRGMTLGDGKLFFYCPDARVACVEARTGRTLWTNEDPEVRALIEEAGRGLTSTPGFKTASFCLYTPQALLFEAQMRMNILALASADGKLLWHRPKTTNNPNMLYLDGQVLVGIGPEGNTLAVDPLTGETIKDLGFHKRSCTRLTATPDSLFVRGTPEGLLRYDRQEDKILLNGAFRPACNDGVIGANGLLYMGPWLCDCNLSLMGRVALCSAGNFDFAIKTGESERLTIDPDASRNIRPLAQNEKDWFTYRANNERTAGSRAVIPDEVSTLWTWEPPVELTTTAPTTAGGLIFIAGNDGRVRAFDAAIGLPVWTFATGGPIHQPPTIWNGRAFIGSGDGFIYALEAATGKLLWRFQAAPEQRKIMLYGRLCSLWPVNTGVLVQDGVVYAAAGFIDFAGTYVYALDALSGRVKWQNTTVGHLDADLRKGVSALGGLTIADGKLWMAGGNIVSPAIFDLKDGQYLGESPGEGAPQANHGEEIGIVDGKYVLVGGRHMYSAVENVVNPARFTACPVARPTGQLKQQQHLHWGKIAGAWNGRGMIMVPDRFEMPIWLTREGVSGLFAKPTGEARRPFYFADRSRDSWAKEFIQWTAEVVKDEDTVAVAAVDNGVVTVSSFIKRRQAEAEWTVKLLEPDNGTMRCRRWLPGAAKPGGLAIDADGRIVVVLANGGLVCLGGGEHWPAFAKSVRQLADQPSTPETITYLHKLLEATSDHEGYNSVAEVLEKMGQKGERLADAKGCITRWYLLGPCPGETDNERLNAGLDTPLLGEPNIDVDAVYQVAGHALRFRPVVSHYPEGKINLRKTIGRLDYAYAYACAVFELPEDRAIKIHLGSDDGHLCWFNGELVHTVRQGRNWIPDQDVFTVQAKAGRNILLLKIHQTSGLWDFSVRLTDAQDRPIDLTNHYR